MPKPRLNRPPQGPSPLQQVQFTRPTSQAPPQVGLVRDPNFWKRFSVAVHQADLEREMATRTASKSSGSGSGSSSADVEYGDQWLVQQHKEMRRCKLIGLGVAITVIIFIASVTSALWYVLKGRK